ncbi:hypothetical protein GN956_G3630 [Arapaima gigas]
MLVLFSEEAGGDFTDPTKPIRAPPPPSLGRILENIKCVCVLKAHSVLIYGPASDRCSREDSIRQLGPVLLFPRQPPCHAAGEDEAAEGERPSAVNCAGGQSFLLTTDRDKAAPGTE